MTLAIGDTYGDDGRGAHGGGGNGGDKVADMVEKIPNEDVTDVTLTIGDIYGNDVIGADEDGGHGG